MNRCECGHADYHHDDGLGPCDLCKCRHFYPDEDQHVEPAGFEGYEEQ